MDPNRVLQIAIGPYGALALALVAVIYLWRKLEQTQALLANSQQLLARQQDLFETALVTIKDDLVPLVKEMARPRR